ncbi:MAG: lipoyl synthase [Planctomycetota bacterium]|jgi:lipoic acid synthetase
MNQESNKDNKRRLPPWLKRRLGAGQTFNHTHHTLDTLGLQTICTNANCPNRGDCWSRGTATVLILGNICTRNCKFCSVGHGKPAPPDATEPSRVATMAKEMKLKYLVITSVDRDDLADGGAGHFRDVILECRKQMPQLEYELLVPDFRDSQDVSLEILSEALPFVFGHNVETVPALYPTARPGGVYERSLKLLEKAKQLWPEAQTKSSLMLGLGETDEQLMAVLQDLLAVGVDRLALGQYLRPSKESLEVVDFITPEKFDWWADQAKQLGFNWVQSSPFTRSSYHAEEK